MSENKDFTRRDVVKLAGAATVAAAAVTQFQGAPAIVKAAPDQMKFGVIGTGGRGSYLLKHLTKVDNGRCAAVCDLDDVRLNKAVTIIGTNPTKYKDYRELLADKNVESVIIAVPLFEHYRVTRDSLQAGKHVFCEKSLVFKAGRGPRFASAVRTAPQAIAASGFAAPVQQVLPVGETAGR